MLNLSDKELDRLSREAAEEHDPGDITGPRSWDRLHTRLDRELGRTTTLKPMRSIRRFPFYYAPAALVIIGVSYYMIRQHKHSGSPPNQPGQPPAASIVKLDSSSTLNAEHKENSTLTSPLTTSSDSAANAAAGSATPDATSSASSTRTPGSNASTASSSSTTGSSTTGSNPSTAGSNASSSSTTSANSGTAAASNATATNKTANTLRGRRHDKPGRHNVDYLSGIASTDAGSDATTHHSRGHKDNKDKHSKDRQLSRTNTDDNLSDDNATDATKNKHSKDVKDATYGGSDLAADDIVMPDNNVSSPGLTGSAAAKPAAPRELTATTIQGSHRLTASPDISDSALRHFTAKRTPILLPQKPKRQLSRQWVLGLTIAPDFTSVNSLAGDKPGSSLGLTVDYQVAPRLYLSSGLLLSRKNYAARNHDFHTPGDFYQNNGIHNIDFVKGSMQMLEVPLNLRYDFGLAGNTTFFASAGASSYFGVSENDNYYYPFFGRIVCRGFQPSTASNYLFAAVNLSIGVEAGLSNKVSLLVAPYVKLPTRNVGFGNVQMNSFGVNFAIRYSH